MAKGIRSPLPEKRRAGLTLIMLLIFSLSGYGQTYNASSHVVINDATGPVGAFPVDSRSMFYDATNFRYRPYASTSEVFSYLPTAANRYGNFIIVVDSGGTLQFNGTFLNGHNTFWQFKDSTGNANLVKMSLFGESSGCSGCLLAANNLSDLANLTTALTNLGLNNVNNTSDATKWAATATVTNKTFSGLNNTFTNIPNSAFVNNSIGLAVTQNPAANISVTTTPAQLGASLVVNIPTASSTQRGALQSADWLFFDNKLDSVHVSNDSLYNCVNGTCTFNSLIGSGGGSGTVTNFTSGNLSPLFNTTVTTGSTTPNQTFTFLNAGAHTVFGDSSGTAGSPFYFVPNAATMANWFGGPIQGALTVTNTGTSGAATLIGNTLNIPVYSTGSGGNPNSNIGSGYRWAVPNTNNIKTVFGSLIIIDSSTNTNALTFTADTTTGNQKLLTQGAAARTYQPIGNYITALTGDVAAAGPGSAAATIQPNAVTYSKFQAAAGAGLLGATGAGNYGLISLGPGLSFSGTTLNVLGQVASVSNSDGTLTISPTTGAVVASLNLAHGNTWVTNPQTFNGGVVLTNNLTYGTDNAYQLGTSSVGASHVWSRVFNSDAVASLSSASGNSANISIGATAGITLLSTGQAQFNNYTGSGFSATSNDSILTINPANGQIGWRWGQPFYIYVSNYGATGLGTIFQGGSPLDSVIGKKLVAGTNISLNQNSDSSITISASGGSGSVTSVAQTVPTSLLSVSGSPITTSGTLAIGLTNASALNVWGNSSGSTGAPGYFEPTSTIMNSWFGSTIQTQLSGTGYSKFTGTSVSYNPQIPLGTDVSGVLSVTQLGAQAVYPAPTQIGFEWNTPVNVGYVGSDLMNFTASGGPTLALSSAKINVTNTVTSWTAYVIDRLQHPTLLNDWIWTAVTQYTSPINAANVGYGPVYLSTKNGDNTGVSCYIRTTGSPTIIMNGTGGTPSLSTGTLHTIATNDLIRFTFQKIDSVIKLYVKDSTTGTLDSCVYTYSLTSGQPIIPNTGNFGFVSFNDNFSILGTSLYSTDTAYATGVLAGDSKFQGFRDTYFANRPYVSLEANYPPFVQYSGQGDRTTDFINKWQELQLLNPEYWIWELGSNDLRNSVPLATVEANALKCYNLMVPKGSSTKVYIVVMPEDSTAGVSPGIGQTNYYNWLVSVAGTSLMPNAIVLTSIWTGLAGATPGVLAAAYNSGDNIHPNAAGAAVITANLLAAGLSHISANRRTQIVNEDPLVVTTGNTTHSIFSQLSLIPYRGFVVDTVGNLVPSTMRDNGSSVLFTKNYPATGPLPAGMPYGFDNGLGVYGPTGAFYFVDRVNAANNFALVSSNNVLVHTNNGNQIGFLSNTGAYLVGNTSGSPHFNSTLEINGSRTIPGFGYGAAFNLDSATYSLTTGGSPAFFSMFDLQHDSLIGASTGNSITDLATFSVDTIGLNTTHLAATREWAGYVKNGAWRFGAATGAHTSINIPAGSNPTTPNDGDIWYNGTNFNIRHGGTTTDLLAGGGSGVTTVGTFSGSSQTNGASISTNTITFGPADGTNPGMVTTGTQTFAGNKLMSGTLDIGGSAAGPGPKFTLDGNVSSTSSTTTRGFWLNITRANTYTEGSSGTLSQGATVFFGDETWAAGSATSYTNGATLFINGPPAAGANVTINNPYALYIFSGNSFMGGNLATTEGNTVTTTHILGNNPVGGGSAPSISAGAGAGTSPTVTLQGTDMDGLISVTTGTTPSLSATIATITYNLAFPNHSYVVLYPANAITAALGVNMVYTTGSTTNFTLTSSATGLTAATAYQWYYHSGGY